MEEIDVAEISPGVMAAAPLFDFANMGVSSNPKINVIQGDAYRALMRAEGRYDIVISDSRMPAQPRITIAWRPASPSPITGRPSSAPECAAISHCWPTKSFPWAWLARLICPGRSTLSITRS
jgi:hypothetical protein